MPSPLLVLLVLPNASPPARSIAPDRGEIAAMERAIRQVVDVAVSFETRSTLARDPELTTLGLKANARAVAEVSWTEGDVPSARLHVYLAPVHRWVDHTIRFDPSDATDQRARALGFAIASILPESSDAPESSAARVASGSPPPARTFALDASLQGAGAIGGVGSGYGGAAGLSFRFTRHASVRLGAAARFGSVDVASATSMVLLGALGLHWEFHPPSSLVGIGARVDALLLRQEVGHFSEDDPTRDRQASYVPGVLATLEGPLRLTDNADVFAEVGLECAFTRGRIYVANEERATLAPVRMIGGAGLRVRF